ENKKSGGGDVRAEALSWDDERDKAKNVFFGFFPLAPTVARGARHSHPSPPEEKAASRKKSRLRRKKTSTMACRIVSCVSRVACPYCGGLPQPTLAEAHRFGLRRLQAALGFASLAWSCPRYAISDGGLAAIDAIDAIDAMGGGWGCPWGCFKKIAVSFWDDAS
ncbi:MAG: hypothetical protein SOX83_02830, partial [Sodaliphilus sp.]|nr:hypothetical protein [Sodaliphilus sp.]